MILVDTSAWIYLFDRRRGGKDSVLAVEFYQRNKKPLAVTDLIIEETHKWLSHHGFPNEKALRILEEFVDQNFAKIISIEDLDRTNACILCKKFLDQGLSYTDAITISIIKRLKLKEVFSFDCHFDLIPTISRVPA